MFQFKRKVNYYETDQMGVVHHSNYLRYFEEVRLEYMTLKGLSYFKMEEKGVMIPVTFYSVKFKRPARFGDCLNIKSKVTTYNGVRLLIDYEIYCEDNLLLTGTTEHTFLNKDFKIVKLHREFLDFHEIFMKMLNDH